jgi:hypothetical protein
MSEWVWAGTLVEYGGVSLSCAYLYWHNGYLGYFLMDTLRRSMDRWENCSFQCSQDIWNVGQPWGNYLSSNYR